MEKKFALQWHITDRCDQRCKHCYIYAGKDKYCNEMKLDEMKKVLENFLTFCEKMEVKPFVAVTGGDPILHKSFWKFLEMLNDSEVEFGVLGNPFHITLQSAKRMNELGCVSYQMSLDGLREAHDYIRCKGSFDETINKIAIVNEANMKSAIMTTVSKYNINDIPFLVEEVVAAGASSFSFSRYCPNENDLEQMVSPLEYRELLEKLWGVYQSKKDAKTKFVMKDHLWKLFLYENELLNIEKFNENIIYDGCHCGITHMTITPTGDVMACRRCDSIVGNVFSQSLYDIFMGKRMNEYRKYDKFVKCKRCELFKFCRGCPAVAKCVTNNFYGEDPQCWKE